MTNIRIKKSQAAPPTDRIDLRVIRHKDFERPGYSIPSSIIRPSRHASPDAETLNKNSSRQSYFLLMNASD
jgi:hypothetical protein